jgi:hypothetical protein
VRDAAFMGVQGDGFDAPACTARGDCVAEFMEGDYQHLLPTSVLDSKRGMMIRTLNGHKTHRTYGRFHNRAMTTTYAHITPSVTPCVWFTVKPLRETWWEASAGAPDTRVLCASLASGREVGGMLGNGNDSVNIVEKDVSVQREWVRIIVVDVEMFAQLNVNGAVQPK